MNKDAEYNSCSWKLVCAWQEILLKKNSAIYKDNHADSYIPHQSQLNALELLKVASPKRKVSQRDIVSHPDKFSGSLSADFNGSQD